VILILMAATLAEIRARLQWDSIEDGVRAIHEALLDFGKGIEMFQV